MSKTRPYEIWSGMMKRCYNKNCISYKHYGGEGKIVCKKWHCFEGFWEDMESGYKCHLSLDRIDNNKGYSPENCRWASVKEQHRNRRNVRIFLGRTITEWASKLAIKPSTISSRIRVHGYSWEKALTKPARPNPSIEALKNTKDIKDVTPEDHFCLKKGILMTNLSGDGSWQPYNTVWAKYYLNGRTDIVIGLAKW